MALRKKFPLALIASFVLLSSSVGVFAQSRPRLSSANPDSNDVTCSPDDLSIVAAPTSPEEVKSAWEVKPKPIIDISPSVPLKEAGSIRIQPLLLAAIDQRLGSRYRWGSSGPNTFDCSGFVWSIYQAAGIAFERSSARNLFARFSAATPEEQYKFGTLVFFNGLSHVGVVADEHGFYHASRHNGVVYAPFEGYWGKHIDGFRRVPLPGHMSAD